MGALTNLIGLSKAAYEEIAHKMRVAGHGLAFREGEIDMQGIAVRCEPPKVRGCTHGGFIDRCPKCGALLEQRTIARWVGESD